MSNVMYAFPLAAIFFVVAAAWKHFLDVDNYRKDEYSKDSSSEAIGAYILTFCGIGLMTYIAWLSTQ